MASDSGKPSRGAIAGPLTRKFGPLPAWAWLGIGGLALLALRGRGKTDQVTAPTTNTYQDYGGVSDSSGYSPPEMTPAPPVDLTPVMPKGKHKGAHTPDAPVGHDDSQPGQAAPSLSPPAPVPPPVAFGGHLFAPEIQNAHQTAETELHGWAPGGHSTT